MTSDPASAPIDAPEQDQTAADSPDGGPPVDPPEGAGQAQFIPTAADVEVFSQVCEHYRQDIRMFWMGASFYIVIHGGLLSVFASTKVAFMQVLLATFGIMAAFYWWRAATGVIFFMSKWRDHMIHVNDFLQNGKGWYADGARMVNANAQYVPAHITKRIAMFMAILWVVAASYGCASFLGYVEMPTENVSTKAQEKTDE